LGLALLTKYTAIMLLPIFLVLAALRAWQSRSWRGAFRSGENCWGWAFVFGGVCYLLIVAVYLPQVRPPPTIDATLANHLAVPGWFCAWRPL